MWKAALLGSVEDLRSGGSSAAASWRNKLNQTLLFFAVQRRDEGAAAVLRLLTEEFGLSVQAKDRNGQTPVFYAATKGKGETIRYLVEQRADIGLGDRVAKRTPLFYAAKGCNLSAVTALLECRSDIGLADRNGQTPLFFAAGAGAPGAELVRCLLEKRAAPDALDAHSDSPLSYAAKAMCAESCQSLVAAGADALRKNATKLSPMDIAREVQRKAAPSASAAALEVLAALRGEGGGP